ncbi:Interleukin-15 [Varanus komodoensis]|nr:Interleukin-15 [Varanus komodoensis]
MSRFSGSPSEAGLPFSPSEGIFPSHPMITCNISVVRCFLLELEVILYESQIGDDPEFHDSVHRLVRSVTGFLSHRPHNEALKCQQCETFEEKPYAEFIKNFFSVARRFRMEELHPTRVTKKP